MTCFWETRKGNCASATQLSGPDKPLFCLPSLQSNWALKDRQGTRYWGVEGAHFKMMDFPTLWWDRSQEEVVRASLGCLWTQSIIMHSSY